MIRQTKALTKLKLVRCGLGPEGISAVLDAVIKNTVVTSLDLSGNNVKGQSITSLGKMFIISSGHGHNVGVLCSRQLV